MRTQEKVKPFLRWAGGKKWLASTLCGLTAEKSFTGYYEPFLGGGSVFLTLAPECAVLSDCNDDLINAYEMVKNAPEQLHRLLATYENTADFYYCMRSKKPAESLERAARFIYLNQTSFNGLYRVNQKGEYNVPYGKRKNVVFELDNLLAVSKRLEKAMLYSCDFQDTIDKIHPGSLVYLDPPYVVAKDDTGFIGYNQHRFSLEDQRRLSKCIDHIKEVGGFYILSNAKHPTIFEIFDKGDTVIEVERTSLIGGQKAYRGKTAEYVFTNLTLKDN